jgi:hypothetical protein
MRGRSCEEARAIGWWEETVRRAGGEGRNDGCGGVLFLLSILLKSERSKYRI